MRLYKKENDTVQILSFPPEEAGKGDYLIIEDAKQNKAMLVQVIDTQFANVPGILEELLRDTTNYENLNGQDLDPLEVGSHIMCIQDARLLLCKIRASLKNEEITNSSTWLPLRSQSIIKRLPINTLLSLAKISQNLPINLGETKDETQLNIDATVLDGKLNIVTGKKGTGKSHLSKLLAIGLSGHGAPVIILDLNGEYINLDCTKDGKKNQYHDKVNVLTPGNNFKVTFAHIKLRVILNILLHALKLPGTSAREFRQIWRHLEEHAALTLQELGEAIRNWRCNQHVRDALFSRYYSLVNSNFFTDNPSETLSFEEWLQRINKGGALVINLSDTSLVDRQIAVEYVLSKLVDLLTQKKLKAVFLFAEEAHLYLRETYWDDIVTRMRHFGIFTTFVTNQPNTICENIYRQADNIFLFNFTNEHDLEAVSRAAKVDAETVKSIARDLPDHHCLILGTAVKDFPMVIRIKELNIQTMGQTRLFFSQKN